MNWLKLVNGTFWRKYVSELNKLWVIICFLTKQFLSIASIQKRRDVKEFFTELYLRALYSYSQIRPLDPASFFRGIQTVEIRIYNSKEFLLSNQLSTRLPLLTHTEQRILNSLVAISEPRRVFEFGTHVGYTCYNLFLNMSADAEIFTLDKEIYETDDIKINECFKNPRVHRLVSLSSDFQVNSLKEKFDFIFIDGDHSERGVRQDTRNAFQMLNPKGIIVWHDYKRDFSGVFHYLNDLSKTYELQYFKGTSLVYFRSKDV